VILTVLNSCQVSSYIKIVVVANYLKALSTVTAYRQKDFMIKAYCGNCRDSKEHAEIVFVVRSANFGLGFG
jgi:hypothetical protein